MGRLTDAANDRIKKNSRASMPDWTPLLGAIGLGVAVLIVVVSSLLGSDAPAGNQGSGKVAIVAGRPTTTVEDSTSTDIQPDGTQPDDTQPEDPDSTGSEDEVTLVQQVAVARITGQAQRIPLVPGSVVPTGIIGPTVNPKVGEIVEGSRSGDQVSYTVEVDPDGAGPGETIILGVTLERGADGGWAWDPAASTDPG